jgi:hypothetical protein
MLSGAGAPSVRAALAEAKKPYSTTLVRVGARVLFVVRLTGELPQTNWLLLRVKMILLGVEKVNDSARIALSVTLADAELI